MVIPDELRSLLLKSDGIVTTAQANKVGISNERMRLLVKSGDLERVAFGAYALPDEFVDKIQIAQLRRPKIIYSHETALFLHDLTDRDPLGYTMTVPTGYIIAMLAESTVMADRWAKYSKKYRYAAGITWEVVINAVKAFGLRTTLT